MQITEVFKQYAYEKLDGLRHEITVHKRNKEYLVMLDSIFYCTAENTREAMEEVDDIITWFDLVTHNPIFA